MSREWKPGDVALISTPRGETWRALVRVRKAAYNEELEFAYLSGGFDMVGDLADGYEARPLVVIDPEDREQVERLSEELYVEGLVVEGWRRDPGDVGAKYRAGMADKASAALRSLITPSKPDEPTGLGAVVEARNGELYIRDKTTTTAAHWKRARGEDGGARYKYSDLAVVEVKSQGWTA